MPVYLDKGTISIRVTEIILPSILNDCNRTLGGDKNGDSIAVRH